MGITHIFFLSVSRRLLGNNLKGALLDILDEKIPDSELINYKNMSERKRIHLCLAHMSESGLEQKYVKEAFDTNWVVPLGPNVNGFEQDLKSYFTPPHFSRART